uniref:Filamin A interacting protein 1 n=1 Tax=Callorhinchus milii TaxID=7868 RepID=A0A4W3GXR5_CALMI|eukprot:gi/632933738/ref/XP_007885787.1/ PREDICTED: filamin-A-interacting protein 1 isoform X2 [Callorhinchus milii]
MRSRSSSAECATHEHGSSTQPNSSNREQREDACIGSKKKKKAHRQSDGKKLVAISGTVKKHSRSIEESERRKKLMELSKDDLLRLLSIMEGEVEAREDIIHLLKSEKINPESLEAHYGFGVPEKILRTLYRDSYQAQDKSLEEDVYEKPIAELDVLVEKHRETYRRMLEQLLLAEKCHRRTVYELDNEKHKHTDYMTKSDDFTNLLEQDRERLKKLLEQEKSYQARKEKDSTKQLGKVREELIKLKSFALMLVDERQLHIEQLGQQTDRVQELVQKLQEEEEKLRGVNAVAREEGQKVAQLEAEIEHKSAKYSQEHDEMTAKLAAQESQKRQLRQKLASLTRQVEELEETNKDLRRAEQELQEQRDKISRGECGNSSLMAEVESLRKRVLEMEGKDEEITKAENQGRELKKRLQHEQVHSKDLKLEVEKLQKRMVDLEKLEGAFNKSKSECSQLHISLEKEKNLTKDLINELEVVKARVRQLESSESKLEKGELHLKDDLTKLKSFTVMLVDERRNMADKLNQEERKVSDFNAKLKLEQSKTTEITEKLIDESKKLLKLKSEMEEKITSLLNERDTLKMKLQCEEEKSSDLNSRVRVLKRKLDCVEETESNIVQNRAKKEVEKLVEEGNKMKELTLEIERLKGRLKHLEVVEGDLMKTEDEYDQLEQKFKTEQDKANLLSQQLEEIKKQITKNKAIEKGEAMSQEAEFRNRLRFEEARSRDLEAEVQALKEKIHELMNKEDQLSQMQADYSLLQKRFKQEENKTSEMGQEVVTLVKELELSKRYSRALRPSMNGRRIIDIPVTSTAVQTDGTNNDLGEEDNPAVFIRKSVQEENHLMSNLRQGGLKKPMERPSVLERYPPAANELSMRRSWIPWMKKKENGSQNGSEKVMQTNGTSPGRHGEVVLSQKQGQPLHIRVTPDHENSTATLEITSPPSEDFFSTTTVIPTLGHQKPRITIIPTPSMSSPKRKESERSLSPERSPSPVTITTFSRAKSQGERGKGSSLDRSTSPIQIMTVSTSAAPDGSVSPEPHELSMGRAVFKVTPEKQTVPTPMRKYSPNANIITTEDNKIHIHLGSPFKRPGTGYAEGSPMIMVRPLAVPPENKELTTGTVLRSPRNCTPKASPNKMTSSITITPTSTASTRTTQSMAGQEGSAQRPAPTRIPMSKGMKAGKPIVAATAAGNVTKYESRAESQSMKIELKKSPVSSSAPQAGGKG